MKIYGTAGVIMKYANGETRYTKAKRHYANGVIK